MSEFDPYLKWLGIRDTTRPVNHYRLLGLDLFESDPDVISMAADRQMAHVRTYQNGPHGEQSQQLLNELARARRCLLTDQKEAYDQQLRQSVSGASMTREAEEAAEVSVKIDRATKPSKEPISISADPDARIKAKVREKKELLWGIVGWISGGVAAVGVSAYLLASGILPNGQGEVAKEQNPPVQMDPSTVPSTNDSKPKTPDKEPPKDNRVNSNPPADPIASPLAGTPDRSAPDGDDNTDIVDPNNRDNNEVTDSNSDGKDRVLYPIDLPDDDIVIAEGLLMPSSTKWTLANSGEYPVDSDALKSVVEKISEKTKSNQFKAGQGSNKSPRQTFFQDIPEEAAVLIGFRIWLNDLSFVSGLQPVYLSSSGVIAGLPLGRQTPNVADVIAEPGYVVSELSVSPLAPMRFIKLQFAKLSAEGIDREHSYQSDCFGVAAGPAIALVSDPLDEFSIGVKLGIQRFPELENQELVSSLALVSTGLGSAKFDPFAPDAPGATSIAGAAEKRTPIPSQIDQAKATAAVRERFKYELTSLASISRPASRTLEARRFCGYLIRSAESSSDSTERYVTLALAGQISASNGDATQAIEALKLINAEFEIDYWQMVNTTLGIAAANVQPSNEVDFKQTVDQLIVDAVEERNFEVAEDLIASATKIAGGNTLLKNWYRQQRDEVRELSGIVEGYEEAKTALEANPEDQRANKLVAEYLFLLEPKSESMFAFWKNSGVASMEKIAELEAGIERKNGDSMRALAEAWHRLGRGKHSLVRYRALRRALETYRKAERLLEEADSERLNEVIKELDAELLVAPSNIDLMLESTSR